MSDENDKLIDLSALEEKDSAKEVASLIESATAAGLTASQIGVSRRTANEAATLAILAALGGNKARLEDSVKFEGTSFVVPEQYRGNLAGARAFLKEFDKAQATKIDMTRTFDYKVYDVAHATDLALKEVFGFSGNGEAIQTPFGPIEPELKEIKTGVGTTVQVPYNRLKFVPVNGHIDIGFERTSKGFLGQVVVNAPKAYRDVVDGLFKVIEDNLHQRSIYRGKAIVIDESNEIDFLDLSTVKREDVVYSPAVMAALEANLWVVLRNMEALRKAGQPIKRAVLLEGPYGTGKSLAGFLTGLECVANGVTFIFAKPGANLNDSMQMAQLYAPAVVFFEDIDVLQSNDPEQVSKLLDTFDGVGGKGKEVIAVLTTNNKEQIHKGMLRPGRLDTLITIGAPERDGVQKIIEVKLRKSGVKINADFDKIHEACDGYMPAFVGEVATRALREAMVREGGMPSVITTNDLVTAATNLRDQFELMVNADEIKPITPFQDSLREELREVFRSAEIMDRDGDPNYYGNHFKIEK